MKFYRSKSFILLSIHTAVTILFSVPLMAIQMMMVMDKMNKSKEGMINLIILYGGLALPIIFLISLVVPWILFIVKKNKPAYITALVPWILLIILSMLNLVF